MHKAEVAHAELLGHLEIQEKSIIFAQEPYNSRGVLVGLGKAYDKISASELGVRAAIFSSRTLALVKIPELCSKDCVAALVKLDNKKTDH